ncbi:unnamed protein product, partial [Coregonus sp. 'balchen']
ISTQRRQGRTLYPTVPENAEKEAQSLFVQEYEDYSGDFRQLPNKVCRPDKLAVHVFEIDEDVDKDEDTASLGSQKGGITKHGWLYKGNMNSAISVTMRNNKVRRFAFELKMQDKSTYLLAADSEGEMEDWISTFNKILHSSFEIAMQEKRNGDIHDDDELGKADSSLGSMDSFQSARDIESKMRNEARLKLFTLDPDTQKLDFSGIEPDIKQYEEKFGKRILVNCNDLAFNLQSCVADNEEGPTTNVEPFYVTLSLLDIQNSRKISSDFHVDLNHPSVRQLVADPSSQYMNGGGDALLGAQRGIHGLPEVPCSTPD